MFDDKLKEELLKACEEMKGFVPGHLHEDMLFCITANMRDKPTEYYVSNHIYPKVVVCVEEFHVMIKTLTECAGYDAGKMVTDKFRSVYESLYFFKNNMYHAIPHAVR